MVGLPAHTFSLDIITYSERSIEGSKYEAVLRCTSTQYYVSFYLRFKCNFREQFCRWLLHMRKDSRFKVFPYEVVRIIIMDNGGVWSLFCELWNEIRDDLGIHCLYVPKDNDTDAAMAEVACNILESMVKKILIK